MKDKIVEIIKRIARKHDSYSLHGKPDRRPSFEDELADEILALRVVVQNPSNMGLIWDFMEKDGGKMDRDYVVQRIDEWYYNKEHKKIDWKTQDI